MIEPLFPSVTKAATPVARLAALSARYAHRAERMFNSCSPRAQYLVEQLGLDTK